MKVWPQAIPSRTTESGLQTATIRHQAILMMAYSEMNESKRMFQNIREMEKKTTAERVHGHNETRHEDEDQ